MSPASSVGSNAGANKPAAKEKDAAPAVTTNGAGADTAPASAPATEEKKGKKRKADALDEEAAPGSNEVLIPYMYSLIRVC